MLTEQRDLAHSRLEILLHFVGHDQALRLWVFTILLLKKNGADIVLVCYSTSVSFLFSLRRNTIIFQHPIL